MADLSLVVTAQLPPQLRFLINVIGLPETVALINERGGRSTYIPKTGKRETALDHLLKRDSIIALCNSDLAGKKLDLPKPDKIIAQLRNIDIVESKGIRTKAELAKAYNLTTRTIQKIWNTVEEENPNMDMFGG